MTHLTKSRFTNQKDQQIFQEGYNRAAAIIGADLCPPFSQQYLAELLGYTKERYSQLVIARKAEKK